MPPVVLVDLAALQSFAWQCAARWRSRGAGPKNYARLMSLEGELGAGKTAFVKALAKALGCAAEPVSPTFVLHQAYNFRASAAGPAGVLHHWDVYRLKDPVRELPPLGFGDMLQEPSAIVCVEWGDRVRELFTVPYKKIVFTVEPGGKRTISYGQVC